MRGVAALGPAPCRPGAAIAGRAVGSVSAVGTATGSAVPQGIHRHAAVVPHMVGLVREDCEVGQVVVAIVVVFVMHDVIGRERKVLC